MDNKKFFAAIPLVVLADKRLTRNDLAVYGALCWFQGKNNKCFPSLNAISERTGVSLKHISEHTRKLQKLGYLVITQRGKKRSNVYRVFSVIGKSDSPPTGVVLPVNGESIVRDHLRDQKRKSEGKNFFNKIKSFPINNKQIEILRSRYPTLELQRVVTDAETRYSSLLEREVEIQSWWSWLLGYLDEATDRKKGVDFV